MSFPAAPTALGVVAIIIIVLYWLLRDRGANASLHQEIDGLRDALSAQAERHAHQIGALNGKVDTITEQYDQQRSRAHRALNDVARCVMALTLVQRLAAECTCSVLGPLPEIVDSLVAELETITPTGGAT